jgi:hypothetical protein
VTDGWEGCRFAQGPGRCRFAHRLIATLDVDHTRTISRAYDRAVALRQRLIIVVMSVAACSHRSGSTTSDADVCTSIIPTCPDGLGALVYDEFSATGSACGSQGSEICGPGCGSGSVNESNCSLSVTNTGTQESIGCRWSLDPSGSTTAMIASLDGARDPTYGQVALVLDAQHGSLGVYSCTTDINNNPCTSTSNNWSVVSNYSTLAEVPPTQRWLRWRTDTSNVVLDSSSDGATWAPIAATNLGVAALAFRVEADCQYALDAPPGNCGAPSTLRIASAIFTCPAAR